jgi:hypothetical protein
MIAIDTLSDTVINKNTIYQQFSIFQALNVAQTGNHTNFVTVIKC